MLLDRKIPYDEFEEQITRCMREIVDKMYKDMIRFIRNCRAVIYDVLDSLGIMQKFQRL